MACKVNLKVLPYKDIEGREVKDKEQQTVTLSDLIIDQLLHPSNVNTDNKYRRFKLADKLSNAKDEVDLTLEDISLIKEATGESQLPMVIGRIYEVVEKL